MVDVPTDFAAEVRVTSYGYEMKFKGALTIIFVL
jgi:hypothetical protein